MPFAVPERAVSARPWLRLWFKGNNSVLFSIVTNINNQLLSSLHAAFPFCRRTVVHAGRTPDPEEMAVEERRRRPEDGKTAARRAGRLRSPGVPGVHVGAVPNSSGHHAQTVLPGQDILGVHHGGRIHRTYVTGLPAGWSKGQCFSALFQHYEPIYLETF